MKKNVQSTWMFIAIPGVLVALTSAAEPPAFKEVTTPFVIGPVAQQNAWVAAPENPAARWKPSEQPDLKEALAQASVLKLEDVAPAPRRVSQGHLPYFCPNPDGKSWDIINPYRKKYQSEGQVLVHDFGSGEQRMFRFGVLDGITPHLTDFHMKSSFYLAQKMIFVLPARGKGRQFLVYDPAKNDFVSCTTPFDDGFDLYGIDIGPDNRLYGMGQSGSRDGFVGFVYDPETCATKIMDRVGEGQKQSFPYYRDSVRQGEWLYSKYGHEPWRLVALNFRTGEIRQLATTRDIKGDHTTMGFQRYEGGLGVRIKQAAHINGVEAFDPELFEGWLVDGKVMPRHNDVPPWSQTEARKTKRSPHRFREFQRWPAGTTFTTPPPEIENDRSNPVDVSGNVRLPYRLPGEEAWRTLDYRVDLYPGVVRRLVEVNNEMLFAVDEGYGQHLFYDLRKKRFIRHLVQRVSPYAVGVSGGQIYVSGYPNFVTVSYNPEKPGKPDFLGYLGRDSETHTPLAGVVEGADGCVYIAGTTVGRKRDGGGLAWIDPATGKTGSQVMIDTRVFWMCTASEKRYVLLSTKSELGAKICCWDTTKKQFVYTIPSLTDSHAGPIEEALPGLVIGHAVDGEKGLLYGLDPATGKVLWRKPVPAKPVTSFSQVRRHAYTFRRGPDGFIWASFGDTLVHIDPRDANVQPVGKMAPTQIAFADGGIYVAGGDRLRRIVK